jgi:DNA primase
VRSKTLAAVYSPRPSPEATVSTAIRWEEAGKVYPTDFTIVTVPERLAEVGDLWVDILERRSDLSSLVENVSSSGSSSKGIKQRPE